MSDFSAVRKVVHAGCLARLRYMDGSEMEAVEKEAGSAALGWRHGEFDD